MMGGSKEMLWLRMWLTFEDKVSLGRDEFNVVCISILT